MPIYDEITTPGRLGMSPEGAIRLKALFHMEPKMRIELTTYALRVRCSTD